MRLPIRMAVLFLALTGSACVLGSACAQTTQPVEERQQSEPVEARLGEPFELRAGQSAILASEGMRLSFAAVTGDSRCPAGVVCVWAGEVSIEVEVELRGKDLGSVQVVLPEKAPTSFAGYRLELKSVEPGARAGAPLDSAAYVAKLVVTKQP